MKQKKSPERFTIQFNPSNPEHKTVIDLLLQKGHNTAQYIADAVLSYENIKSGNFSGSLAEIFNKVLTAGENTPEIHTNTELADDTLDFDDIADALEGFRN